MDHTKWIKLDQEIIFPLRIPQCPIKMRVFHQNESCLACPHPSLSYEEGREQVGSSHFDENSHFDRTLVPFCFSLLGSFERCAKLCAFFYECFMYINLAKLHNL